jgi:hairy-and-enhancer-of-split protein
MDDVRCVEQPMSRTFQYRKVMKPLLERKRRARINKCLDELKDLMLFALEQESGEGMVRLEKADILEVTVRHMRKLKAADSLCVTPSTTYAQRFRTGFTTCAGEVGRFIASPSSGFDHKAARAIVSRLSDCVQTVETLPSNLLVAATVDQLHESPVQSLAPSSISGGPLDLSQPGGRRRDPSWRPW